MDELVKVATTAGKAFSWSQKYADLLITSAGAVFRNEELDESRAKIDVGLAAVLEQSERLKRERQAQGASPRTISSYVAAWKRLATVARAWAEADRPGGDDPFWTKVATDLADTRVRRLVGRSRPGGATPVSPVADSVVEMRIRVSSGYALVTLPIPLSERDVLSVINTVSSYGLRHADPVSSEDAVDEDEGA
jgi:hypothetical protein